MNMVVVVICVSIFLVLVCTLGDVEAYRMAVVTTRIRPSHGKIF